MREIFASCSAAVAYKFRTPSARRRYMLPYETLALKVPKGGLNEQMLRTNGATPRWGMTINHVNRAVGQVVGSNILSENEYLEGLDLGLQRTVKFAKQKR